jgi:hypothetical protein
MDVEIKLFEFGAYRPYCFRFLSVGMDEMRSLQRKNKHKGELVAHVMNSTTLLKQERQDELRRATRTVVKKAEKCIEVDGGILNTYFEPLQFIDIIYITNKSSQ